MFESLNSAQKQAVEQTEGALLVLAGAGTGKTKVLTSRIVNILNKNLATPYQILAVTFTNKAAAEMRHRIGAVIGDGVENLWIGTFHSIAAKITRRHAEIVGLKSDFTIIDQDDQLRLIKQILGDFNIDTKQFPAKNYLNKVSHAKDVKLGDPKNAGKMFSDQDYELPKLDSLYQMYQTRLKAMNACDFGDLLAYNLEIFAKAPEILQKYQEKFRYVLVDEYQDTNNVQYQWLLKLADAHKNLCAVGDDDQSIYSWRGANVANILRFEKDFDDAKIIRLEQNYRSTSEILHAADSVISNNKERHGKTLFTDKEGGEAVKLYSFLDDRAESRFATTTIQKYLRQKKYQPNEIAILVRAGYQTRSFEEALIKESIAYRVIGGMKFYERQEIKDAICYLRAVTNPNDDLALTRIVNVPKRGIGKTSLDKLFSQASERGFSLYDTIDEALICGEVKGKAASGLRGFIEQMQGWKKQLDAGELSLGELTRIILSESGYTKMWQAENTLESQGRLENIDEFISSLEEFDNITEFLEYVSLVEAKDEKNLQSAVNIMTVHGAKGLEFDLVFVPGLEDGLFPSGRSLDERNGLEEERRLLYVAITRAKKELILTYAKTRFVFGDYQQTMPSRFIEELPKEVKPVEQEVESNFSGFSGYQGSAQSSYGGQKQSYGAQKSYGGRSFEKKVPKSFDEIKKRYNNFGGAAGVGAGAGAGSAAKKSFDTTNSLVGSRMFHQKFGYGKVIGVDGKKLEISFEKGGVKTVMKDFVSAA